MSTKLHALAGALLAASFLSGCGGGGGGGGSTPAPASTTMRGTASKGPLKLARVTAFPVSADGVVGSAEIAHQTTDANGAYTLDLGSYTGTVQLVLTAAAGATTADEASGQDVPLPADFILHANTVVTAATGSQIQSASITPYTELAHNIARNSGAITAGNVAIANSVVFSLIGLDPVGTVPLASNTTPNADATDAQKRYALFNAAVSKLAGSAPQTADPATLACFSGAGTDLGKKIQCAAQQIATSVTVTTGSNTQAVTTVNKKLVGLSAALVSVAADAAINKTGNAITTNDSAFKTLDAIETAAANGSETAINGNTSSQTRSDVANAKLFFSGLRSNAAALRTGPVNTGIVDGVKAFGDSLNTEAASLTLNTVQVVQLTDMALSLWTNYTTGHTTNPNSPPIAAFSGGCTVYQSTFPTQFGGAAGARGEPYVSTSVAAIAISNASWVGCSVNQGQLRADGTRRYRQTLLFNMLADSTLAAIPYLAVTRAQYIEANVTYLQNLTPTLHGTAGFTQTNGQLSGVSLAGDLPPATTATGALLAARYPVDVAGRVTQLANGAFQAVLSRGKLGVVAVSATETGLSIDLSPGGASIAVIPQDYANAAQVAAAKVNLEAAISDAKGRLAGTLLIDQLSLDAHGSLVAGHVRFTGEMGVAPVVANIAGPVVTFLSGSLEVTQGSTPVVSFSGSLTLPNRPVASLTVSVTETSVSTGSLSLEGRYVQGGMTVTISGSRSATGSSATFADASGVSITVSSHSATSNVTVSGRQTAVIDKDRSRITYSDGTFESFF